MLLESLQSPLLQEDYENHTSNGQQQGSGGGGRTSLHIQSENNSQQSQISSHSSLGSAIGDFAVPNSTPQSSMSSSSHTNQNGKKHDFVISEIPWIPMLTHSASLCLLLSNWVYGWIGYMLLTELPSFLNDELGYDIESSGLLSIAPFIANLLSVIVFAQIFDYLQVLKFN